MPSTSSMFTFNRVVRDEIDEQKRRRIVTVEFINDQSHTKQQTMEFSVKAEDSAVKRAFAQFLDELNFVPSPITDLAVSTPTSREPTAEDLERQEWEANRNKLREVMDLVRDGVFTGTEKPITDLQALVRQGAAKFLN